jgi:YrbI family 3-deoxy-D-manno-octulosonate 8-phosphate phosphatase
LACGFDLVGDPVPVADGLQSDGSALRHVFQEGLDGAGLVINPGLLAELAIDPLETACVGDDTPDLPMLRRVGLAVGVADAHPALLEAAHWITRAPGGRGAVREVCDLLLSARAA